MTAANPSDKAIGKRTTARVGAKLDKSLIAYAAAASAAGLSALAPAAEAKIVYTPANIPISSSNGIKVGLDINNDGIRDFFFSLNVYKGAVLNAYPARVQPKNAIWGTNNSASALPSGYTVGGNAKFQKGHRLMVARNCSSGFCSTRGPWQDVQNMYLGLAIVIRGQVHYGWARLNVSVKTSSVITGYAYETTPNKSIVTGQMQSSDEARANAPADLERLPAGGPTLGLLAQGSSGLPAWRRETFVEA